MSQQMGSHGSFKLVDNECCKYCGKGEWLFFERKGETHKYKYKAEDKDWKRVGLKSGLLPFWEIVVKTALQKNATY